MKILVLNFSFSDDVPLTIRLRKVVRVQSSASASSKTQRVEVKSMTLDYVSVGGRESFFSLVDKKYEDVDGIVFVVDSTRSGFRAPRTPANEELYKQLRRPQLDGLPLLVFADKQHRPNSMTVEEVSQQLKLEETCSETGHKWFIQGGSAETGAGIVEGMKWLINSISPDSFKDYSLSEGHANTNTNSSPSKSSSFWSFNIPCESIHRTWQLMCRSIAAIF